MKIILVLALLLPLNSYAQTVNLTSGEFPPFVGSNLENGGLATEIVSRIFNELGDQAIISFRPWKRGYSETLSGKYSATFPYSKNKEREKTFFYSNPIYELEEHFFTMKSANINYTKTYDLTDLRICKPLGYNLFGLKKLSEDNVISLASPKSMGHCFKMLATKRVDMVLTNEATGWEYVEKLFDNPNQFSMAEKSYIKIGHYFITPKNNQQAEAMIREFNKVLETLKISGEIDLIKNKHLK